MNRLLARLSATLLLLSAAPAFSQVNLSGSGYTQNFDGMGTSGTAAPTGWTVYGLLGGGNSTWTTSVPASGIGGGTAAAALHGATTTIPAVSPLSASRDDMGYNFALAASNTNRALGTSPTGGSGVILQLSLTNNTGTPLSGVQIGYAIRRFTAVATANELPGYWLFYSVANGAWTNVAALSPALTGSGVLVPNTTGVTTVPLTTVNFSTTWAAGANLRLRWVDDNAVATSPARLSDWTTLPSNWLSHRRW